MPNRPRSFWILIIICLLAVYVAVLLRGLTESTRRSLLLRDETDTTDRMFISIEVTNANTSTKELTARLGFRVVGSVATDNVTPAVDLKLLINNIHGPQEFDFPKGKRMNRIDAMFPLQGDSNKYPLDHYATTVRLLMISPARNVQPQTSKVPGSMPEIAQPSDELTVGSSALQDHAPVALSVSVSASMPGIRFTGNVSRGATQEPTGINLGVTRANSVIVVSLIVMLTMAALSTSLLAMVLKATTAEKKVDLLPLSLSISLIFGMPALRNIQPGVPPVGVLADYIIFIWAELIVAASAVIIVWTWLFRSRPESESLPGRSLTK